MLQRKLTVLAMAVAIATSAMMPVKKAEAGAFIPVVGGGIVLVGISAGFVGAMTMTGSFCWEDCNGETEIGLGLLITMAGIGLIVLDENTQSNEAFNTIPPYLLQEVQDQAAMKAEALSVDENGLREVVFTHEEVDEIFELADESTLLDQLDNLREILTTRVL